MKDRRTAPANVTPLDRLLSLSEVRQVTSFSRSSIYRMVADGMMPAPLKIGASRIAWRSSDLNAWLSTLPKANTKAA